MDQVRAEFEELLREMRRARSDGALAGTDGERTLDDLEELAAGYRSRLDETEHASDGRALVERFRSEADRL